MERALKFADSLIVMTWPRWLVALLAFAVATGVNFLIQPAVQGRVPFLPYFPALVLVGLVGGTGPGVLFVLATVWVVQTFWVEPVGVFWPIAKSSDALAIVLFVVSSVFVLGCAAGARFLFRFMRQAREAYGRALQAGGMAAWRLDVRTGALTFTEGAREVLGTAALPKNTREGWTMINAADRALAQAEMEQAIRSERDFKLLTRIGESDDAHWVETHGRVTRDPTGKPEVSAVIVDVTVRQRALMASQAAEQRLQDEAKRKDTFLATLAHELRNPLAPIRYALAMLGDDAAPARRQKAKDVIERQSSHMARLLDDLLDMSRITRNAIELQREVVDLREVALAASDNVRPFAESSRISLVVADTPEAVLVDGDATRLQQIVGNLLDNALKFTSAGGKVTARVHAEGDTALVEIKDSGAGIDPGSLGEVFELFTQLQQPGRGRGGLGIGLAVVKQLVELHGGSVTAYSEGAGTGTCFTVRLPRAQRAQAEASPALRNVVALTDAARALIVDDNVDAADMLAACLRENGYAANVVYTGGDALESFRIFQPSFVLLDIGLPDLLGTEVARRIRLLPGGADARLVAITGWGQETDRAATHDAGFDMHFVKPVDPHDLLQWLHEQRRGRKLSLT